MKRIIVGVSALALALTVTPSAAAQDPAYGVTTSSVAQEECGTATVTWSNPTEWTFFGDYKLVGEGGGESDDVTGQTIGEGPLAGQPFGKVYHQTEIPAGETVSVPLEFDEDAHDGQVKVMAWVKRGPEQRSFSAGEAVVDTDCAAPVEPTEPPVTSEPTVPPTTDPNTDPTETSSPTTEPTDDEEIQDGDEAEADGSAPTPTPQKAHLAVTG